MIKKILHILLWVLVIAYLAWTSRLVCHKTGAAVCKDISIEITDSSRLVLLSTQELKDRLMAPENARYLGEPLSTLPLPAIEALIEAHPAVRKAEAFTTYDGTLHLEISQRIPILRILNSYGESFYIDEDGCALQPATLHAADVPVATGRIPVAFAKVAGRSVLEPAADKADEEAMASLRMLCDIAGYLRSHEFWNAQIQEINLLDDGDIRLIPRVGPPVLFGAWQHETEKFDNLLTFYQKALNTMGWQQYKQISVKYQGQIIGIKK